MENLRALRRRRSLTFLDLAALTGIPARQLAEIEYGLRRLTATDRESLALVLDLPPNAITGAHARAVALPTDQRPRQALIAAALAAALATGTIGAVVEDLSRVTLPPLRVASSLSTGPGAVVVPAVPALAQGALAALEIDAAGDDAANLRRQVLTSLTEQASAHREQLAPTLLVAPTPGDNVAPPPLPVIETPPAFVLTEQGPLGCPVRPAAGQVVMTQGYGVGTHAPAMVWGAIDLAVDADGDGYADAASSWYAPILATHDGHVTVTLNSDPGGNHVWVNEPGGVWRTGYAHLALVTVVSGQFVRAGEQIGLLGSTGRSTGPHLDYQVWRGGVNIDPTLLVGCQA